MDYISGKFFSAAHSIKRSLKISLGVLSPDERHEWEVLYYDFTEYYQLPMNAEMLETVCNEIFNEDKAFYALVATNLELRPIDLMHFWGISSP